MGIKDADIRGSVGKASEADYQKEICMLCMEKRAMAAEILSLLDKNTALERTIDVLEKKVVSGIYRADYEK